MNDEQKDLVNSYSDSDRLHSLRSRISRLANEFRHCADKPIPEGMTYWVLYLMMIGLLSEDY